MSSCRAAAAGEGVRSDELRGGMERTYELMHSGSGNVRCAHEHMWWRARAHVCGRQMVIRASKQANPNHSALTTEVSHTKAVHF